MMSRAFAHIPQDRCTTIARISEQKGDYIRHCTLTGGSTQRCGYSLTGTARLTNQAQLLLPFQGQVQNAEA